MREFVFFLASKHLCLIDVFHVNVSLFVWFVLVEVIKRCVHMYVFFDICNKSFAMVMQRAYAIRSAVVGNVTVFKLLFYIYLSIFRN